MPELLRTVEQADRDGLDHFSLPDHPYLGERLDAYAAIGFVLGRTRHIAGIANVSNLPTRPAPMLARTVTTLSALSGGRVVLGMGAGSLWDRIADLGVDRLSPGEAVDAFEEAIVLIRSLGGGGAPVTHRGRHYRIDAIEPAPVAVPPVWTGSVGRKSLAATGRVADGWIPGHAADWLSERYRESRPVIDAVLEHGASGFTLFPSGDEAPEVTVGRWAGEVVPAVREAVAKEYGAAPGSP
ncbi:LLM class flavin-dependent oxidoreductase [Streptomyces griseus]|uniref:LLM class flavin-dependent oxidoreductase n=1 Tax=Streptomyces griseus TaxID=1911 RepID=UPI0036995EAA